MDERWYYYCDNCQRSEFLGDELRGTGEFTQLAEERIALAGKEGAYAASAKLLKRLGVVAVAGSTVRAVCVRLGRRARQMLDHAAAQQHVSNVAVEEHSERVAIGVDGTMLGRVDPQHRKRQSRKPKRKVCGKGRLHNFFHEVKTLVIFNFDGKGEAIRKTFQATQERVEDFREKVILEAQRRGAEAAKVLVFLGDGAPWIWKTAKELFPKAIQILDWYHAVEHLWAAGRTRFGQHEKELWAWVEQRKAELWNGQVERVIEALRVLSKEVGTPNPELSQAARERDPRWIAYRTVGYFEENRGRMDYPRFRTANLPIGSGVVESSCKHVVGDRMKRTGMRWDEEGGDDLLALRCLDLSDRWDSLWPLKATA